MRRTRGEEKKKDYFSERQKRVKSKTQTCESRHKTQTHTHIHTHGPSCLVLPPLSSITALLSLYNLSMSPFFFVLLPTGSGNIIFLPVFNPVPRSRSGHLGDHGYVRGKKIYFFFTRREDKKNQGTEGQARGRKTGKKKKGGGGTLHLHTAKSKRVIHAHPIVARHSHNMPVNHDLEGPRGEWAKVMVLLALPFSYVNKKFS